MKKSTMATAGAAPLAPKPGNWSRLTGCVYSYLCTKCGDSGDTMEAALRRQHAAAGGPEASKSSKRRIVVAYASDMKGLMQILGHAGPNATFPCMFCYARLHKTNVAGVPHLPDLPEPWKSQDLRDASVINPELRAGGTKEMAEYARQFAAAQAEPGASANLSSAAYFSCAHPPMIDDDDLQEHLSRTPLHITLGLGTNYLNLFEALCIKLDLEWATCANDSDALFDYMDAHRDGAAAEKLAKDLEEEAASKREGMEICLLHDPKASRGGRTTPGNSAHEWCISFRGLKKEAEALDELAIKARADLAAAEKKQAAAQAALMHDAGGIGPFQKLFDKFLKNLAISRQKYFGGTFIGPDLHTIFGCLANIRALCALLAAQVLKCPDGVEREFGSETQVKEMESVLLPFGELHSLFSRKESLCEHDIAHFSVLVREHAIAFAKVFPTLEPTPKMHILCFHMEELLARHGSVGMDTEQGIESFHPEITYITNLFRNMDRQPEAQIAKIAEMSWARGGGQREGGEGLKKAKHERAEKNRETHKAKRMLDS